MSRMDHWLDWMFESKRFVLALVVLFVGVAALVYWATKPPTGCYYVVDQGDSRWRVRTLHYNSAGVSFETKRGKVVVVGTYSVTEYGPCR